MTDSKEVIDAIVSNNLDKARDATKSLLYQKAADLMSSKKEDIASQYTILKLKTWRALRLDKIFESSGKSERDHESNVQSVFSISRSVRVDG